MGLLGQGSSPPPGSDDQCQLLEEAMVRDNPASIHGIALLSQSSHRPGQAQHGYYLSTATHIIACDTLRCE